MLRTLNRTLIAGAAMTGALTFGSAGLAGAATTTNPTTSTATLASRCAKAEARVPKIEARLAKAADWLPKAQAREAAAKAAGHTKVAEKIAERITKVEKGVDHGKSVLAKIAERCGGATAGSTGTTGTTGNTGTTTTS